MRRNEWIRWSVEWKYVGDNNGRLNVNMYPNWADMESNGLMGKGDITFGEVP